MSKQKISIFGEYIRGLREAAGLPLRKVASQLDIDPSLLGKNRTQQQAANKRTNQETCEDF